MSGAARCRPERKAAPIPILARVAPEGGHIAKRNWRWAAIAVLALALAALLASRWREGGFDWAAFHASFRQLRWPWVGLSALLALATYYGRALRWEVMLRPIRSGASLWGLFKATAIGFTAVVLFGRPGEFVRPYLISVRERVPFSSQMAAWLLERILDLLTILLVFALSLTQIGSADLGPKTKWIMSVGGHSLGISATICIVVIFLLRQYTDTMRKRILEGLSFLPERYVQKLEGILTAFLTGLQSTRSSAFLFLLLFYTLIEWVLIVGCFACLFRAFPETASFGVTHVIVFMGFVALGSIVQLPGVGGGMQLVSVVVLTELFKLPLELATSIAILAWVITFVIIVPPGLLLAFLEGLNWRKLRHLEGEVQP